MSSYFSNSFLITGAAVAIPFLVGGMILVFRSLLFEHHQIGEQKKVIAEIGEQLHNMMLQQVSSQEQISALQEKCKNLNARQQMVEKHGSDVQRIDLAMRMLKRGVGNAETLRDLGLSASEIKLLLRLHSSPTEKNESPSRLEKALRPVMTQTSGPTAVKRPAPVTTVRESGSGKSEQVSQQGRELARLFKTRVAS